MASGTAHSKPRPGSIGMEAVFRAQPPPGARQIAIEIRTEAAREVVITGEFTKWATERYRLRKDPDGVWRTNLHLPPGEYQYRLLIDGDWRDDPQAVKRVPNSFGGENCVMIVPAEPGTPTPAK